MNPCTAWPPPGLGSGSHLIGVGDTDLRHAVTALRAHLAVLEIPNRRRRLVRTVCGTPALLVPGWGSFSHDNRHVRDLACPRCSWQLALEQNTVAEQLAAIAPPIRERAPLEELIGDPLIAVRLCRAILDRVDPDEDPDNRALVRLLAHATMHAPQLVLPEECRDKTCSHRPEEAWDDPAWECPYPDAAVACATCSVLTGPEAGEWEGFYTPGCTVTAPCSVLTTLAQTYHIPCPTTLS